MKHNHLQMLLGRVLRGVFPPELRAQATAAACRLPQDQQVLLSRWSISELARHLKEQSELASVSLGTLARWLRDEQVRPWRYRMWQHISQPSVFMERAGPVLEQYAQATSLLQQGCWLVCVDEKTSLQAREAEQPPRAATRGHCQRQSPRYYRRGARHLLAALSVADGKVLGRCFERKRFVDFQAFVTEVLVPDAQRRAVHTVKLILDNGPTHAPKQLEQWLKEQSQAKQWGINFQVLWLPTNASWLDQIEIWFSILQRKLLQPNHFVSTDHLQQAISEFIARYNQTAKPINWTYTVDKLARKLGMQL